MLAQHILLNLEFHSQPQLTLVQLERWPLHRHIPMQSMPQLWPYTHLYRALVVAQELALHLPCLEKV